MLIELEQLQRKRETKNLAQKFFVLASLRRFLRFGQNTAFAVPNRVRDFFQVCFKLFWENMILNHLEQSFWFFHPWNHPGGPKPFLRSWRFTKMKGPAPLQFQNQVWLLNRGIKCNHFDALNVHIAIAEHIKRRKALFLNGVRSPLRDPTLRIFRRVESPFE